MREYEYDDDVLIEIVFPRGGGSRFPRVNFLLLLELKQKEGHLAAQILKAFFELEIIINWFRTADFRGHYHVLLTLWCTTLRTG